MRPALRFHKKTLVIGDEAMQKTVELAAKAARTGVPVLICGESGTGKELIARFIHDRSPRSSAPFVSVNCAAVPEGLIEAEFFGFERGAFTGAIAQRVGKFERAQGGTLLLDEISEMPFGLQAKLLRVLQEGEIDRLGGRDPIAVNCRVIATTNREPLHLIREGRFREDLFYRLNVIRIDCHPLRGRKSAIKALVSEFVDQASQRHDWQRPEVSEEALTKLGEHSWPGNIRELQNAIERAVILAEGTTILAEHFDFIGKEPANNFHSDSLAKIEEHHIQRVLGESGGNRSLAAERLGITARTLRNKLKEYGN